MIYYIMYPLTREQTEKLKDEDAKFRIDVYEFVIPEWGFVEMLCEYRDYIKELERLTGGKHRML